MTKRIVKAGLCVVREGKLLIARSAGDAYFQIPGGKIDIGESDVEALMREASEELGIILNPDTALHLRTFEAAAAGRTDVIVEVRLYQADFAGTPRPLSEIAEVHWQSLTGPVVERSEMLSLHILPFLAKRDRLKDNKHE
ncbi:MAG: NUDIX domain-containing protein [Roseobacter sp.]